MTTIWGADEWEEGAAPHDRNPFKPSEMTQAPPPGGGLELQRGAEFKYPERARARRGKGGGEKKWKWRAPRREKEDHADGQCLHSEAGLDTLARMPIFPGSYNILAGIFCLCFYAAIADWSSYGSSGRYIRTRVSRALSDVENILPPRVPFLFRRRSRSRAYRRIRRGVLLPSLFISQLSVTRERKRGCVDTRSTPREEGSGEELQSRRFSAAPFDLTYYSREK